MHLVSNTSLILTPTLSRNLNIILYWQVNITKTLQPLISRRGRNTRHTKTMIYKASWDKEKVCNKA